MFSCTLILKNRSKKVKRKIHLAKYFGSFFYFLLFWGLICYKKTVQ